VSRAYTANLIAWVCLPARLTCGRLNAIRDLLESGGRTLVQGALAWLWAKSPDNIALPGARTVKQVEGLAAAIALGPLPASTVKEIAGLVGSEFESEGTSAR